MDRLSSIASALTGLLFLLAASNCSPPAKPGSQRGGGKDPLADVRLEKLEASDSEEAMAFAEAFASAISGGDDQTAQAAWHLDALLGTILKGTEGTAPDEVEKIVEEFRETAKSRPGGVLWSYFGNPCRALRFYGDEEDEEDFRVLFRVVIDGGINYLDLLPQRTSEGTIVWVDAYVFSAGEKMSRTFRRLFLPQLAKAAEVPLADLIDDGDPPADHLESLLEMSRSIQAGRNQEAIDTFRKLPEEARQQKSVMLGCLSAAAKLLSQNPGNAVAAERFEEFRKAFGENWEDDPSFLLMNIDDCIAREDFDTATKIIGKLQAFGGADPFLSFYRASVLMAQGKFRQALPHAEGARESEPEIEETWWAVNNLQLALKNFRGVAETLDALAEQFDYTFDLASDPDYTEFLDSPEGKAWAEKHSSVQAVDE